MVAVKWVGHIRVYAPPFFIFKNYFLLHFLLLLTLFHIRAKLLSYSSFRTERSPVK